MLFHYFNGPFPLRSPKQINLKWKDERTLVDLTNFKYLIQNSPDRNRNPYFVIIVSSEPSNQEMRETIRSTWAHSDDRIETYFALGAVESAELQQKIEQENAEYNDMIQGNFIDSPNNLTYKHVMALKWFKDSYTNVKYLVKMDDDVFANVINIYNFLFTNKNDRNFLMGIHHDPEHCPRNGTNPISFEEYASEYFPSYVESSCVIYSADVVRSLYEKSYSTRFFRLDDVFVTGFLKYQLNFGITSIEDYLLPTESLEEVKLHTPILPKPFNFMFSTKPITMQDQRCLWERTEFNRIGSKVQQLE